MSKTIIIIPSVTYTFHCPLSFSEIIPNELNGKIDPIEYTKYIHSINLLLQSCITKSVLVTGRIPCCKTTHTMYHGTSDGIRCVTEYLNNNSSTLPPGHSMCLITTEQPPFLRYEISSPENPHKTATSQTCLPHPQVSPSKVLPNEQQFVEVKVSSTTNSTHAGVLSPVIKNKQQPLTNETTPLLK
ncbi:hypothetical protein CL6EHI_177430 [Entamoeba histolytica]|uniref:Uncharacterized protein n=1 Tax=Entamoeba histolytica TaxID=5759 RepID=A0A175JJ04_ENTHI|nr:hypothetical protein CL6EHI_177430 [Entamoeba histolytica]